MIDITSSEIVEELAKECICEDCNHSESNILYICKKGMCIYFAHLCEYCFEEFKKYPQEVDWECDLIKGFS